MGRASNRKKIQRQAGPSSRQASRSSRADAETQQAMLQVVGALQSLVQESQERKAREAAARRTWSGGAEPVPAEVPRWPEGSLGDRFFGGFHLGEARNAPCLATAEIPDAAVIAADPAHWNVAASALVRAVVFDGLALDHPAVRSLFEVLAPIAEAELAFRMLGRIEYHGGDPLENLATAGAVPPGDVLPVGLTILSALAQLCRSDSASLLQRAA